jgi:hypothetical protein
MSQDYARAAEQKLDRNDQFRMDGSRGCLRSRDLARSIIACCVAMVRRRREEEALVLLVATVGRGPGV